jgi:hypothetical protein
MVEIGGDNRMSTQRRERLNQRLHQKVDFCRQGSCLRRLMHHLSSACQLCFKVPQENSVKMHRTLLEVEQIDLFAQKLEFSRLNATPDDVIS